VRILAIDPGGTTGLALWTSNKGGESIQQWEIADPLNVLYTVRDESSALGLDALVCERFDLGPRTQAKSTAGSAQTIELIGALRWLAAEDGCPFILQAPVDAVQFVTDEKLRNLGWWCVGKEHARSATRHLVLYLATQKIITLSRLAGTQ
jgi:hypothetical protein